MEPHIQRFLENATVPQLKDKLKALNLDDTGLKSALKIRLEDAVRELSETDLVKHFPKNVLMMSSDSGSATSGDSITNNQSFTNNANSMIVNGSNLNNGNDAAVSSDDVELQELESLRRKLKIRQEINDLKNQLSKLTESEVTNKQCVSFRDIEEFLIKFSGDDAYCVKRWIQSFEETATIYDWNDNTCLIYARRLMIGTAKLFLRTVSPKSWNELKMLLMNEFAQHVTNADIHNQLRSRKKKKDESYQAYVLAMQEIASLGDIEETDIINYIINGIADSHVNKMLLYNANSLQQLKIALRKYEKIKQSQPSSEFWTKNRNLPSLPSLSSSHRSTTIKCFNCNGIGHLGKNCQKPQRPIGSCFNCGKLGHKASDCRARNVMNIQDSYDQNTEHQEYHSSHNKYLGNLSHNFEHIINFSFKAEHLNFSCSLTTLIDTGSSISFIQQQYVPSYLVRSTNPESCNFHGINGSKLEILGQVCTIVNFKSKCVNLDLFVVKNNTTTYSVVLGRDFIEKFDLNINFNDEDNSCKTTVDQIQDNVSNKEYESDIFNEILSINVFDGKDQNNLTLNEKISENIKKVVYDMVSEAINSNEARRRNEDGCLKCAYFSSCSGKVEGTLHNIPKGNTPFEVLHIDHFGPLAASKFNKKYILVVVDGFTKFTKLYATKGTATNEVISCLKSYFNSYSRPRRIISDRATCFTSQEFTDFLLKNDIIHHKIATMSPQSNGQVERINRLLKPMLSKLGKNESTSNWYENLEQVEFALNNSVNRSIGNTPSKLLFGIEQKGKLCDRLKEYLDKENRNEPRDLDKIRQKASETIEINQNRNKTYYDKRHKRPKKYKEGDFVMLRNIVTTPGINKKLLWKYRGPYVVKKVLENDRYFVKDLDNLQVSRVPYKGVCTPQNMKPYIL